MEFKEVNQSLGKHVQVGIFSLAQFLGAALAAGVAFILLNGILSVDVFWSLLVSAWLFGTCAVLSGDKPYLFWSKLWPTVPNWVRGYAKYDDMLRKKKCRIMRG
jgi:hypothetical protein